MDEDCKTCEGLETGYVRVRTKRTRLLFTVPAGPERDAELERLGDEELHAQFRYIDHRTEHHAGTDK